MIIGLKGWFQEYGIGISTYCNFGNRQFQSLLAQFSDWGLLRLPQSEAADYTSTPLFENFCDCHPVPVFEKSLIDYY